MIETLILWLIISMPIILLAIAVIKALEKRHCDHGHSGRRHHNSVYDGIDRRKQDSAILFDE